ncbi:MAG: hypothetical protein A2104_00650 [Candidatus Melainabacteria bacterium GWF2_32_7]|nr:MAG: hypothetical protein A2104_00650 [Candidatus Melainabacteria bacterium GWF2_32_7]
MSIGGVTGLPFQKDYLNAQKISSEQNGQFGVFSSKQEQGKVLSQKLQDMSQTYQTKGSIFQTESLKTNVVEDGYMGKLVDQKWAQVNFEYEQTNVKRLSLSNQSLENAVIKSNVNLRNYEATIKTTNIEVSELDKKINSNTKELESMSQIFATEEQSKAAKEYAKSNYDYSVNKENSINKDLTALDSEKNKTTANVETTKQKKADAGNVIFSLKSNKTNISQRKTSVTSRKSSLVFDLNSIKGQISELKGRRGVAPVVQQSVTSGNNVVESAPNSTVAIDTADNNNATATLAEAQNSATVETENSTQTSEQNVQAEITQAEIDAQIDAQILSLETSLIAIMNEQNQLDNELKSLDDEETKISSQIENKQKEETQIDSQIENIEKNLPEIDNKIALKQKELENNKKITQEKESIYKKACENHDADLEKRQTVEAKYNKMSTETVAMKDKRTNSDKGLKKLNSLRDYFSILVEGQGNAKAGTKAELEVAEQKETKQYETLQVKNGVVESSKLNFFSQMDITNKAKGDLTSVKTEMENYANVFSSIKKA